MALLELSLRYISTEGYVHPVKPINSDLNKSKELALKAKTKLEELTQLNDGEAMRMLAYTYLGHWGPYFDKSLELAEELLLKAYEAKCYVAANDISSFYVHTDLEKAKHWYKIADKHKCRVIFHEECET